MATMTQLRVSNTIQALIIAAMMAEYKNARTRCLNECVEKSLNGATMEELGPFIDGEQLKAKAKMLEGLKESVQIITANLAEAKTFEVRDEEFITNTEYALEKAATLHQII